MCSFIFPDEVAAYELKQKDAEAKKERLYVTLNTLYIINLFSF